MTRRTKRLGLSKETLRGLSASDLQAIGGGGVNNTQTSSNKAGANCGSLNIVCLTDKEATCTVVPPPPPFPPLPKL